MSNAVRFVGTFHFLGVDECKYYSSDNITFYDESGNVLEKDEMEEWTVWVNSPWSMVHEGYDIRLNCKDAYSGIAEGDPEWKCIYSIIGYDGITASVIGYGNTVEEALHDCKELFSYLQKTYNPDDVSI